MSFSELTSSVKIELQDGRLRFSFLKNQDFVSTLSFPKEELNFLDYIYFETKRPFLDLDEVVQINSESSGINLTWESLISLAPSLATLISNQAKKNGFNIQNSTFTAYFYTLSTFCDYPDIQLFDVWEFSTLPISTSRDKWLPGHFVKLRNCCLRNLLRKNAGDFSKMKLLSEFSEFELDENCVFPNSLVDIRTQFSRNLLKANNIETEKQRQKLNLILQEPLLSTTEFNQFPICLNFVYTSVYRKIKEKTVDSFLAPVLEELGDKSFFNTNCKDLFTSISFENLSFEVFLLDSLFTIYSVIQNPFFAFDKKNVQPIIAIKLVCIDFIF